MSASLATAWYKETPTRDNKARKAYPLGKRATVAQVLHRADHGVAESEGLRARHTLPRCSPALNCAEDEVWLGQGGMGEDLMGIGSNL